MKLKFAALALMMSAMFCCSQSEGQLLDRMLNRGGCGVASSCCNTPSSGCKSCSLLTLNFNIGGGLLGLSLIHI